MEIRIRKYSKSDAAILLSLFYHTIHSTNSMEYSPDQINAWAPSPTEGRDAWGERLSKEKAVVAETENGLAGFGTLQNKGTVIGMLYVDQAFQKKGIGSAILKKLEKKLKKKGIKKAIAEVSLTARPFFEKRGYLWVGDNRKMLNGEEFLNFLMEKKLKDKKNKNKKDKKAKPGWWERLFHRIFQGARPDPLMEA